MFALSYSTLVKDVVARLFVAIMAFFARISDAVVGGTYMTFLNTLSNLGSMWPATFVLWFVDLITYKTCEFNPTEPSSPLVLNYNTSTLQHNQCYGTAEVESCKDAGAECQIITEGFYTLSIVCVGLGTLLYVWVWRTVQALQEVEVHRWRVVRTDKSDLPKQNQADQHEKIIFFYCF